MVSASPPPARRRGFPALLRNRSFLALWSGQILSQVGDKIFLTLAIALGATYQTFPGVANTFTPSAIMLAFTLPAILFGSAAGIFVDRWYKKQILVLGNIFQGIFTLAILVLPRHLFVLLATTFLISTINQFFVPAEQAALPQMVRRENLMSANAVYSTTLIGSLIVGFGISDLFLRLASTLGGASGGALFLGGIYLLAAFLLSLMRLKERGLRNRPVSAPHPWHDLQEGLRYLQKNRLVSNAMVQLIVLYSVFAALTRLAINLAQEIGLAETQFGFLLAGAGVGLLIGAAVLGIWGDRFHHKPLPLVGFLTMAFALAVFTFVDRLWVGLTLSILMGFGASLVGVPMQTLIQQQTPENVRGKVFGFQNNAVNIALALPLLIATILVEAIGLRSTLLGMSIGVTIAGIWAWRNTRRVLKDVI